MKKLLIIASLFMLLGASSFAQTNKAPAHQEQKHHHKHHNHKHKHHHHKKMKNDSKGDKKN